MVNILSPQLCDVVVTLGVLRVIGAVPSFPLTALLRGRLGVIVQGIRSGLELEIFNPLFPTYWNGYRARIEGGRWDWERYEHDCSYTNSQKLQSLQKESSSILYQMVSVMNHKTAVMISILVERVNIQSIKHKFKMNCSFHEEWHRSLVRESNLNGRPIWNSVRGEGLYRPGVHNGT